LIVECNEEKFAIPQINVVEMVRAGGNSEYIIEVINNKWVLRLRESLLPLVSLSEVLKVNTKRDPGPKDITYIVVCEVGGYNFGVIVDRVFDTEEIVVKPVAPVLKSIDLYSGSTLLGDGSVIMILDPNGIVKWLANKGIGKDTVYGGEKRALNKDNKQLLRFLILRAGKGAPKAVPLELVSRLEEIEINKIELSNENQVVQYRDSLMYLTKLNEEYEENTSDSQQVVVFSDKDKIMGLMVEDIMDIVEHPLEIVSKIGTEGFVGSMIIDGKTTDLLDIGYFFDKTFGEEQPVNASEEARKLSNTKILLIDDSPFFRKFISQSLYASGYNAIAVESAQKALQLLDKDSDFFAIVTDLNMPEMSGIEFAKNCYENPRFSALPIIILSSTTNYGNVENLTENLKFFVSKTNHEQLITVIGQLVTKVDTKSRFEGVV
jgi:two-component system chemotaxis sensor kinase CheA